jgi:hypothetical protein
VSCGKAGVAHTSSNRNRGVAVPVIGTATPDSEGQRYAEFSGIPDDEIHAVSGIWSHTGGQVSGSAWAATHDIHPAARPLATSIVARTRRMPLHPMSAQS